MNENPEENKKKPKRGGRRKTVSEPELGIFLRKYRRKAPKGGEPNDRSYSRDVERRIKQMPPEELDRLMNGNLDDAEDNDGQAIV